MKIRLKNFKGIKAGPELTWDGLDEIEVDFTGKTGLVAFSGENGGGKSTLIENLHHYPQLVSRGGALWQHVLGRSAEKEFISTFMGREYRSLIKMDSDQGKQEGYLWIDGKSEVDGKITQYKEKVNGIFGQPFTYFRSQFCPQKSKNTQGMQIENMTAGVFRELLQQFLNLQRYAIWSDTSKQAGDILSSKLARCDSDIEALKKRIGEAQATREELGRLNVSLDEQKAAKADLTEKLAAAQKERESLKETIARNEVLSAQVADLKKILEEMKMNKVREESASGEQLQKLREAYQEIAQEIKAADAILASEAEIREAAGTEKQVSSNIQTITENGEVANTAIAKIQDNIHNLEKYLQDAKHNLSKLEGDAALFSLDNSIRELTAQIVGYKRQLKALEGRDNECVSSTCTFILSARKAEGELSECEKTLSGLQIKRENRITEVQAGIEIVKSQISNNESAIKESRATLAATQAMQTTNRQELARARLELTKYKDLAARQSEIAVAKSKKEDRMKALEENKKQGVTTSAEWTARAAYLDDQRAKQQEKINEITESIDKEALSKLTAVEVAVNNIETSLTWNGNKISHDEKEIAALQSDLSRVETAERELEAVKAQRESLVGKISRWRYLQIGCGKTGLQNLRIDGAAPRIIYNANKLLSQAYGARYSVRLETQNEDGKEDLQIKIIMENGKEVYLDDISGGQRAWNVQSLWLAMSLLNQEKSGRKYDYFCSDESDGALDVENAVKYTALYRPFMAEGNLDQLIFISHKEQCRSMADHVLMFEAGKNPTWQ